MLLQRASSRTPDAQVSQELCIIMEHMSTILQCPVCRNPLIPSTGGYQCSNRHTFDVARQGYVNLMLAHKKHSKEPGDSPAMIQSRRRFLDQGFYDRVSDGINEVVAGNLHELEDGTAFSILDAGCGEGFYLKRLKEYLMGHSGGRIPHDCYGVDISKFAVGKAAQRDKTISWAVANIVDLPFASGSLDMVMNVFALADFAEFSRILRETGKLVIVTPGPRHLNGLREIIYPVSREHTQPEMSEQTKGLFTLSTATRVNYPLELKRAEEIMDLLAMTPYFWNIDLNTKSKVEALNRLELEVDVVISVFSKTKQ